MPRKEGRNNNELREVTIERGYLRNAEGSALIKMGGTHVICAATVEEKIPKWMMGSGEGWITAECHRKRTPRLYST